MVIEDKWVDLKDGRKVLIRNPREEDIEAMLKYIRASAEETEFLNRAPEDFDRYTYEGEKEIFKKWNESENDLALVGIVDGKLAGNCQIVFFDRKKIRHRASIGIAFTTEFWGLGIGSAFLQELIDAAKARPEMRQIELEFVEGNSRARALYEKMGFRITGVRPNAVRLKDGTFVNEYMMVKEL